MVALFLAVDIAAIALLVVAVIILRRTKPTGESPAPESHGEYYPANASVKHELDGFVYTTLYTPPVRGKNPRPSVLTLKIPVDTSGEFEMVVETPFDKFCKRLGIATEVQTGDEQFDELCYIRTDAPDFTAAYLADPIKRVAILDLRRFEFLEVALSNGELSAKRIGFDPKTDDRPELMADVGARLVLLARDLPAYQPEFDNRTGTRRRTWQTLLWIMLVGFALSAFSLFAFVPLSASELLLCAVPVLVIGWPLFAFLSAWVLSGTSRSHRVWAGLMIGTLILFPIGSAGAVGSLNGVLDDSPATTHNALIVEKYTTRSKNSTNYHVRCVSWRKPGETESFQVSSDEYGNVFPNRSKLVIVTKVGWLGIEWLESKRVDALPKP